MPKTSAISSRITGGKRKRDNDDGSGESAVTEVIDDLEENGLKSDKGNKKYCIICGSVATRKIVKDDGNFEAMMQMYWCTLGIDVKPNACQKTDLCRACFERLIKYYETNDIMVYFENYFKEQRSYLVSKTLKGVKTWEKEGRPLTKIHEDVKNIAAKLRSTQDQEDDQVKATLNTYKVEHFEIPRKNGESGSGGHSGVRLSRMGDASGSKKKPLISLSPKRASATGTGSSSEDSSDETD